MNDSNKTIFKNAGFLMASQLTTWVLTMALMVVLPRYLGPTAVGQLHLAASIWAIMGMLISFGIDMYITKAIARSPTNMAALVGTSIGIRAFFYFVGFGLVALYAYGVGYSLQAVWVIYIFGFSNLFSQIAMVYRAALEGLERMGYIALSDIAVKLFTTVAGITLLLSGSGVLPIAFVFVGASFIGMLIQIYYVSKKASFGRMQFSRPLAFHMLQESATYLSVLIFRTLYIQVDIIIISLLVNETVIGWYGAADSLFGTLLFVPTVFITAAFPALSRMYTEESDALPQLMQRSFTLLLLLAVPVGLGLFVIADNLVVLLFGAAFANSGPILAIFGIVLIFTYQNMLIGRFLIATNRQRHWSIVMAVATLATIPLDLLLIPWCQQIFGNGGVGGALAFIVTEFGILMAGLWLLPKGSLNRNNLRSALKALFVGGVMALIVWQLRTTFIAIPIAAGAVIYIGLVLLLGIVPKEDLQILQGMSSKILFRIRRMPAKIS
jgi:O-antigen/teichoic acid export membrane protein